MKRKRAAKVKNAFQDNNVRMAEINEVEEPVTGIRSRQVEKNVNNGGMESYPNRLREMIVSIIKDLAKEGGGLGNLSSSLGDNPIINGQMGQPHDDMNFEENESGLHHNHNPEYKQQELNDALTVIKKTMKLDAAAPFTRPVDPIALEIPDYFDIIDTPMDFGTICNNLENGLKYMNSADVFKDVQYIWYNCLKYNKKGDHILELMNRVKTFFMKYWIAAGLHTEQSTSIIEAGQQHSMRNEEHYSSPVTHVADHPSPINMLTGQLQHTSSQSQSFSQEDEPNIDSTTVQQKRQGRGPTRCLKLLNTAGRIKVVTNEMGQPVGSEASLLTSFLGLTARDGNLAPLIYPSWSKVPQDNKEDMWQKVLTKFDIDPCNRSWVLRSLGSKWRNFKALLKATRYNTHATDKERLADRDERVLPEQWSFLVSKWSSEKWQNMSAKNKANRARQKFIHATGKKSFARIREEEKAKRPDGQELSRAELFILTRTRKNGQPVNEETAAVISQLRESATKKDSTVIDKNESQDDAYNRVMGLDRKGSSSLFGLHANPSHIGSELPTRAEALKMVEAKNAEVLEMKEKLAAMEQTCSQMASQMSAMVSMMATFKKDSASQNLPSAVAGTSSPMCLPNTDRSEPISLSNYEVPAKQTRGRKKKR
ncbi:uncharacterized protein [Rutidosis leptorrhynchoides]|uniref:uncharacterized protein isoform X3 n=1 Tax=Rutidosis leptorrhynchoides TaxID=125765 RepID=UPI003A99C935